MRRPFFYVPPLQAGFLSSSAFGTFWTYVPSQGYEFTARRRTYLPTRARYYPVRQRSDLPTPQTHQTGRYTYLYENLFSKNVLPCGLPCIRAKTCYRATHGRRAPAHRHPPDASAAARRWLVVAAHAYH